MAITWILVANASLAKLYANYGPNKGLKLVKELIHPESRQKNKDLVTDRPGSIQSSPGSGYESHTPPKTQAARAFAQELAQEFYQGRNNNAFGRAILVAPPAFMGMLNAVMDGPTAQLVTDRVEKDYTKTAEPDLAVRLGGSICL
ncbi:host attachment protein [Denitromonas iodatirespirans]|uniref:Host attachment protein n=1 Tax=Denitromonas iodatirespirans TaxID=2795389 RepID=A0A944D9R2_DENI1|nr:host attachment protein [Denitromonas iodatirespirans]MBT0961332.1 host attachment protein [Denitromonas iodatirespirans]